MRSRLLSSVLLTLALLGCGPAPEGAPAEPPPRVEPDEPVAAGGGPTLAERDSSEGDAGPEATEAAEADEAGGPPASPRAETLELTFVGDVIFGRYRDDGYDPIPEPPGYDPFEDIHGLIESDVLVANLETPVIEQLPERSPIGSKYRFGAERKDVALLAKHGFAAVSLANNHYFDLRQEGQRETPRILTEEGIMPIGQSREDDPLYRVETLEREGWKVGFVAVTTRRNAPQFDDAPRLPFLSLRDMRDELVPILAEAREAHDVLVVFVHWGDEYAEAPDVYTQNVARALIDEGGADLIVGHHPHVLQAVERHGKGLIAYSMGNFLFENTNAIPRLTGVLRVGFSGESPCLSKAVFHVAHIARTPSKHPVPSTGYLAKTVRNRVISQAGALGTEWVQIEGSEDLELPGLSCG